MHMHMHIHFIIHAYHDIITSLLEKTYKVHFPYSINVLVGDKDEEKKLMPVKRYNTKVKIPGGREISVKSHHVTLVFAITFHKIQCVTLDKAIMVLNNVNT